MEDFNSWKDLLNPQFYIDNGGFLLILFIVFAETGLFIGFFLPGDSLLFVSGIFSVKLIDSIFGTTGNDFLDTTILASCVSLAAIIGNEVGYFFGVKTGPALYKKNDTMLFKKKHLYQAHDFFEKHGSLAIIMARFLPVVRTFTPIVAGIVKMDKKVFFRDNVIGAVLWSFILIFAGHYLDKLFRDEFGIELKSKLEYIILVIVLITTLPVVMKFVFGKKGDFSKYENNDSEN